MNVKNSKLSQLSNKVAVSTAFLSAVADRLGFWIPPESPNTYGGNWEHFLMYSNKLNFYASLRIGENLAMPATSLVGSHPGLSTPGRLQNKRTAVRFPPGPFWNFHDHGSRDQNNLQLFGLDRSWYVFPVSSIGNLFFQPGYHLINK